MRNFEFEKKENEDFREWLMIELRIQPPQISQDILKYLERIGCIRFVS